MARLEARRLRPHGLLLLCALAALGCNCPIPRIDPSGQRLFIWESPQPATAQAAADPQTGTCCLFGCKCCDCPLGHLCPGHGPKGQFVPSPGKMQWFHDTKVLMAPVKVIAPVGAEVVVTAAVCGQGGHLMANQRVEWTIAPGSVGHFVDVGPGGAHDWFHGRRDRPEIITQSRAIGITSARYVLLNRGTPALEDDVPILRGQAWATVCSPVEGTSYVTAFVPDVYGWDARKQTATIQWVDTQWTLPPAAVNPVGTRHTLTTTVARHTTGLPLPGWIVRYELSGGPPAGFAPDGSQAVEVATNSLGQASAELFQVQPAPGTNTIQIQVIRPAGVPGSDGTRMIVGSGVAQKTWTAPYLSLRVTGPAEVAPGAAVTYRIDVQNPGELPAKDVLVTNPVPAGLNFTGANPPPTTTGPELQWRLGDLPARQSRTIEVSFSAERAGTVNNCASARAADGLSAQDCATTTIVSPTVEISLAGPAQAVVGQQVALAATVTNRSGLPATGLLLVSRFDPGLEHAAAASPIELDLSTLQPGESRRVDIMFRVTRAGRLCATAEIVGEGVVKARAEACLTSSQPADGVPGVQPPAGPTAGPQEPAVLQIRKTGPNRQRVGEEAQFKIDITNTGRGTATNLKLVDSYDLALNPVMATDGFAFAGDDLIWRVDVLPPGRTIRFEINCRCLSRVARACNRATVTCDEGARADAEACLEIIAAEMPLAMTVADLRDPLAVGNDTTYEIRVTNQSEVSDRNVVVTGTLAAIMAPIDALTRGPGNVRHTIEGQVVRFAPISELRPGETVVFRIGARAVRTGDAVLRVEAASANTAQPVTAQETTSVFQE